jgi:hypothetical protein
MGAARWVVGGVCIRTLRRFGGGARSDDHGGGVSFELIELD